MTKNTRFSPEVRQRAVRMVLESQGEYDSQWAAICSIAPKIGCTPETLRVWVRQHERDTGSGDGGLTGIKDVYTCEIVGYAMGERMTKELTGKALFMALRSQRPPAGLIHHSDRGSQYCAYDYRVIQEQFGLKTSMSRKGNCYDNAPMESFWGTLKNESLSHYRFNNRDEAISVIREYIEIFYNRQRRHSRLGNISPAAIREKYHQMAA
ncbi:IS3 family transposase [Escherichia coli]|nr:IS3 family transposase [Escherichia coli]